MEDMADDDIASSSKKRAAGGNASEEQVDNDHRPNDSCVKRNRTVEINDYDNDDDAKERKENISPLNDGNVVADSRDVILKLFNLSGGVPIDDPIPLTSYRDTHDPASIQDLENMFHKISKALSNNTEDDTQGSRYINVMQFSSIFRCVTGEKGNLFKEMQTYQKFNVSGNGAMNVNDFVQGWLSFSRLKDDDDCILRRIKFIMSRSNPTI